MTPVEKVRYLIVGAGPCGLGAALALSEAGEHDWLIVERESYAGGLSASFCDEKGYTWDIGGHVLFSHCDRYSQLMEELLGQDGWLYHDRESAVRILGEWVPYPFQNNIHRLPQPERDQCLKGLEAVVENGLPPRFTDFEHFIRATTGEGISRLFMMPYNYKVWAYPPSMMDAGWIGDRVSIPDIERIRRNIATGQDDTNWGPNNRFQFPKHGGTGAIWRALAERLSARRVCFNTAVVELDIEAREAVLSDGRTVAYDAVLSTMPIDRLVSMARRDEWIRAAEDLRRSSTHIVGVGIKGPATGNIGTKCWMYFPEDNCPFYRVTHFSHYSPNNSPDIKRYWSLMCEVSESPEKTVDHIRVVADCCHGLVNAGLLQLDDMIDHTWHHWVDYGYPTPSRHRDRALNRLLPELMEHNVFSRGRFGAWKYEVSNMDHSFMQGYEFGSFVTKGQAEVTVWDPRRVNGR